jgi:signal transduction histidine kinase
MVPPDSNPPPNERGDTDASLRLEREKTDQELAATRAGIEEDADGVVELARERAETTLRATRARADRALHVAGMGKDVQRALDSERADEDRTSAEERATEDERLFVEREQRQGALNDLLRLEREATDERLLVERARADETIATRDDFLGMVSHDLRTLLGGIALNAALLAKHATQQGDAGTETLRHADRIQRFTARMNRLVGDLLDVVSLEAGRLDVRPGPRDAVQLVRDATEAFQPAFSAKGISFGSHVATGTLLAKFDHERILQVLANLLSNALKFTDSGGTVSLLAAPDEGYVRFSVIDTGVGVPADQLGPIFERFRQLMAKDRRGLGLGLYISRCIVEAHGGRIWAERTDAPGVSLHFTLPSVESALEAE